MLHLITPGPDLPRTRLELRVPEQGIDIVTADGPAMFDLPSVLAALQRELIVTNPPRRVGHDSRSRRKGGPGPDSLRTKRSSREPLDDAKERTVAQIAGILDVPRITIYRHVAQSTRASATVAENGSAAIDFQPGGPPRESDVLLRPRLVDATGWMMFRCSLQTEFDLGGVLSGTVSGER